MSTCQICERVIKDKAGVIAHHGYQRPGDGWQTASCFGARYKAYELSNDRMQPYIDMVKGWKNNQEKAKDEFLNNPPETITYIGWIGAKEEVYKRPEGFNPKQNTERGSFSGAERYQLRYANKLNEFYREIRKALYEIERMEKRLANWKK